VFYGPDAIARSQCCIEETETRPAARVTGCYTVLLGTRVHESASKSRVFGVSLNKCLRRDVEQGRRLATVSPSSESSLLDALSLHSAAAAATTRRLGAIPRLDAQRLYDEQYCSSTLLVPHVVRVCCQHLKTHGKAHPIHSHFSKPPFSSSRRKMLAHR